MKAIAAALLAILSPARSDLAPEAIRAIAVVELAKAFQIVNAGDVRRARAWLTKPGRFPDSSSVAAYLDPESPVPSGDDAPPPLPFSSTVRMYNGTHREWNGRLSNFGRAITGIDDLLVCLDPTPGATTMCDHALHQIRLAWDSDFSAFLHELGHAALGASDPAIYQRTFRDVPGVFQGASTPADTELWQGERDADAVFSAGILSAARASRSYWQGIAGNIASTHTR